MIQNILPEKRIELKKKISTIYLTIKVELEEVPVVSDV